MTQETLEQSTQYYKYPKNSVICKCWK